MSDSPLSLPEAGFTRRRAVLALAALPLAVGIVWGIWHVNSVIAAFTESSGSPLATTFLVSFLLLWWVPLSWLERPCEVSQRKQRKLDHLRVTVHVPVYNEDPATLQAALTSVLEQTRLPQQIHVVDDGSAVDYAAVRHWFRGAAARAGVDIRWVRTVNRGKRHAQMETLRHDDADIFVTLDSDSTLDSAAIAEGLKPFTDPQVMSVAGMVVVWNSRKNFLTRMTCMLYTPFTRGFRSAQSVIGQVMVNSGTLAFYRSRVIRRYAGSYENEQFWGRPMQMNDDSMMTFYALLEGRTVHQPSSVAFTVVPDKMGHYLRQQLRWMRGTFIRTWWWVRYLSPARAGFWMPILELSQLVIALLVLPAVFLTHTSDRPIWEILAVGAVVGVLLNYLCALRYFVIERSDESGWVQFGTFLLAPLAGVWRLVILRPMIVYAMLTFWKVGSWGTRATVEVTSEPAPPVATMPSTREMTLVP